MFVELQTPEVKIKILINEEDSVFQLKDQIYKLIGVVPGCQIIKHKDENGDIVDLQNEMTLEENMVSRGDILTLNYITVDLRVIFNEVAYVLTGVDSSLTLN